MFKLTILSKITTVLGVAVLILGGISLGFGEVNVHAAASSCTNQNPLGRLMLDHKFVNCRALEKSNKTTDFDGYANAQCVDLSREYIDKYLNIKTTSWRGGYPDSAFNAFKSKDANSTELYSILARKGKTRDGKNYTTQIITNVSNLQRGDIVIIGGHTGVATGEKNSSQFEIVEQNYYSPNSDGTGPASIRYQNNTGFTGAIRINIEGVSQSNITIICGFVDIANIPDQSVKDAICDVKKKGLINGNTINGLVYFRPNDQITRGEIAVIVERLNLISKNTSCSPFKDTNEPAITNLKCNGIVGGYKDGTFRPNNVATRAEADLILTRILAKAGRNSSTLFGDQTRPNDNITRAEFAIIANRASLR